MHANCSRVYLTISHVRPCTAHHLLMSFFHSGTPQPQNDPHVMSTEEATQRDCLQRRCMMCFLLPLTVSFAIAIRLEAIASRVEAICFATFDSIFCQVKLFPARAVLQPVFDLKTSFGSSCWLILRVPHPKTSA